MNVDIPIVKKFYPGATMNSYVIENFITKDRAKQIFDLLPSDLKNNKDLYDGKVVKEDDDFLGCIVERNEVDDIVSYFEDRHKVDYYGSIILRMIEPSKPHSHTGRISVLIPLEGEMKFNISNHVSEQHSTKHKKYPVEFVANYKPLSAIVFDGRKVHWSGEGGKNIRTHLVMDFI